MDVVDPLRALEHDHVHLGRLLSELRRLVAELQGDGEREELSEELAAALSVLRDDLFEHFGREEEALFPFLSERLPDLGPSIGRLEGAHDRICGAVVRLHALAALGAEQLRERRGLVAQLFSRFDGEYVEHARQESEFLRGLGPRLDPETRAQVRRLLDDA